MSYTIEWHQLVKHPTLTRGCSWIGYISRHESCPTACSYGLLQLMYMLVTSHSVDDSCSEHMLTTHREDKNTHNFTSKVGFSTIIVWKLLQLKYTLWHHIVLVVSRWWRPTGRQKQSQVNQQGWFQYNYHMKVLVHDGDNVGEVRIFPEYCEDWHHIMWDNFPPPDVQPYNVRRKTSNICTYNASV